MYKLSINWQKKQPYTYLQLINFINALVYQAEHTL